ncbi:Laccase domain-containing protein 1 [Bulinus truncatus]|nr:Laccase domain-containing protein 1 [Bulinus truncatus]
MDLENITDFVLITSLLMKKYWERMCLHIFSHVHNWLIKGVDVTNQPSNVQCPEVNDVETNIKEYLKTVGNPDEVRVLRSKMIPEYKFNAGFHERYGGVSNLQPLASLNMVYTIRKPDSLLAIHENRRRLGLAAGFDSEQLMVAKVEHGKSIWVVGKTPPARYDGIVTNIPGIIIAAPGADCSMILLADTSTGACGAVHAGWRGTTLGAVRACLKTMIEEFGTNPADVVAAIGPTVDGKCFDLPAVDASPVNDLDPSLIWPSNREIDYVHADLVKANVKMLELDGVPSSSIDTSNAFCTVCNKQFFSHRRDGVPFGNQIGFISCRVQK